MILAISKVLNIFSKGHSIPMLCNNFMASLIFMSNKEIKTFVNFSSELKIFTFSPRIFKSSSVYLIVVFSLSTAGDELIGICILPLPPFVSPFAVPLALAPLTVPVPLELALPTLTLGGLSGATLGLLIPCRFCASFIIAAFLFISAIY